MPAFQAGDKSSILLRRTKLYMEQRSPGPSASLKNIKKVAEMLGDGRMSKEQKAQFLEEHRNKRALFSRSYDFVSHETYEQIFSKLDLNGKTVINAGAGFSLSGYEITHGLQVANPEVTLIPFDYTHHKTASWLLLEKEERDETNDSIQLEPVTGDVVALPFKDNSIDGYTSVNLINIPVVHITAETFVRDMFTEAHRVLKQGGFILISSFGYFKFIYKDGRIDYNNQISEDMMLTGGDIKEILSQAGFVEIQNIPLDNEAIQDSRSSKNGRNGRALDTIEVVEPCAFLAFKK